jgi:hypothetical protein
MADANLSDFEHSCADCKPRPLDRKGAHERQRRQRQNHAINAINTINDRRTKRPPSKSHKKKLKPSDLQAKDDLDRDERSPKRHTV